MAHRFKVRQLAYAQTECCGEGENVSTEASYDAVVILARLTEQGLGDTVYSYRVATQCGKVGDVKDEDLLSPEEYEAKFGEDELVAAVEKTDETENSTGQATE